MQHAILCLQLHRFVVVALEYLRQGLWWRSLQAPPRSYAGGGQWWSCVPAPVRATSVQHPTVSPSDCHRCAPLPYGQAHRCPHHETHRCPNSGASAPCGAHSQAHGQAPSPLCLSFWICLSNIVGGRSRLLVHASHLALGIGGVVGIGNRQGCGDGAQGYADGEQQACGCPYACAFQGTTHSATLQDAHLTSSAHV